MDIPRFTFLLGALLSTALRVSSEAFNVNDYVHYKASLKIQHLTVSIDNRIAIQYNVSRFVHNHQHVQVSWQGVYSPATYDYLALYVGDNYVDPKLTLPVQFVKIVDVCPDYIHSGNGSAIFRLINMRADFRFMLLKGIGRPVLMGVGPPLTNAIRDAPTSGHLGLHSDQRSIVVQWTSGSSQPQEVQWGAPGTTAGSTGSGVQAAVRRTGGSTHSTSRRLRSLTQQAQATQLLQQQAGQRHSMSRHSDDGGSTRASGRRQHEPPLLQFSAGSTAMTYKQNDMCGAPATTVGWLNPGYLHAAIISGEMLLPNMRYTYRYGSEATGWSEAHVFTSPPPLHSPEPFTFLAFNDVCQGNAVAFSNPGGMVFVPYGNNSLKLAPKLAALERDAQLALLIGDLAYALGYAADWDYFGDQFEDVFTQWPLVTATGNHERDWPGTDDAFSDIARDSGGECNVPYHHRYYTPARAQHNDPRRSFYSFDFASVHFLILDSESPSDPDSVQGRFVAEDLAGVDRSKTPWLLVAFHRMMYAPTTDVRPLVGDADNESRLQKDFEDLFYDAKVDVVLTGHEHAYACTCKVYHKQCVRDGPTYVVAGHAGAGFTHGFPTEVPQYFDYGVQDQNGYMRFTVSNATLLMEMVSTDDGEVKHSVMLNKNDDH